MAIEPPVERLRAASIEEKADGRMGERGRISALVVDR